MKNELQLTIVRVDYKNLNEQGFAPMLPRLTHTSQITDIDELTHIVIRGESTKAICEAMPKSWKVKVHYGNFYENGQHETHLVGDVQFDTFTPNKVTGDKNESAIKRRIKVIEHLASLGL